MAEVDLSLLATSVRQSQEEGRERGRRLDDLLRLTLSLADHQRRLERRMTELKDDLELIIKIEITGRLANA